MAGMDVHRFLTTDDAFEARMMQRVANRVDELAELRDDNLAVRIRNQIGELFS